MRILHLVIALALIAPAAAQAQDNAQQMLDLARKMRAGAEQMKGSLPPDQIAEVLRQADEIEQGARRGAYSAPAPAAAADADLPRRIQEAHGGRLEWLAREAACAGYTQENFRTFRFREGRRDDLCRTAYGHWAEYLRITVNGGDRAAAYRALEAYDRASQAAVDFHAGR